MRLLTLRDDEVSAYMRRRVDCFLRDLFPGCTCAHEVKRPTARLILCEGETAIVGHLALYLYDVRVADRPTEIGVIGEVAIGRDHRGEGLLKILFPQAHEYFEKLSVAHSMVFPCHPGVYAEFGYKAIRNNLFVLGSDKTWRPFTFPDSMYCPMGTHRWTSNDIYFSDEPCQT